MRTTTEGPDSAEPMAAPSAPLHRPASCSHPPALCLSPCSPQRVDVMVLDPGHGRWASFQWGIHSGCRSEFTDMQAVITISSFPVYKRRHEIKFEKHFRGKGVGYPKPTLWEIDPPAMHLGVCMLASVPALRVSSCLSSSGSWSSCPWVPSAKVQPSEGDILLTKNPSVLMVLFLILWHLALNWTWAITDTTWVNCWNHLYENGSHKTVLSKLSFNSVLKHFWSEAKVNKTAYYLITMRKLMILQNIFLQLKTTQNIIFCCTHIAHSLYLSYFSVWVLCYTWTVAWEGEANK